VLTIVVIITVQNQQIYISKLTTNNQHSRNLKLSYASK